MCLLIMKENTGLRQISHSFCSRSSSVSSNNTAGIFFTWNNQHFSSQFSLFRMPLQFFFGANVTTIAGSCLHYICGLEAPLKTITTGEGNVFTGVCLFTGDWGVGYLWYQVPSEGVGYAWYQVPSRGWLGYPEVGYPGSGGHFRGWYASYWNVFLLLTCW